MLDHGWICLSVSPYGTLILFVYKKTGEFCMYIDYYSLNHQMRLNVFPIPPVAALFDRLGKATVFSSITLVTYGCTYSQHLGGTGQTTFSSGVWDLFRGKHYNEIAMQNSCYVHQDDNGMQNYAVLAREIDEGYQPLL